TTTTILCNLLLPFALHIISIDRQSNLRIWDIKGQNCETEVEFPHDTFAISAILHPGTYAPSSYGNPNIKRVYKFKGWEAGSCRGRGYLYSHPKVWTRPSSSSAKNGALCLVGFSNGRASILISSSNLGHLALWDLEKRGSELTMKDAHHDAPILDSRRSKGNLL
ncbi:Wdrepeat proteinlike, partial [Caligus rogercresseyi]